MGIAVQVALALMVGVGWITLVLGLRASARGRARAEADIRNRIEHLPEPVRVELRSEPLARGRVIGTYVQLGLIMVGLVAGLIALRPWLDSRWVDRALDIGLASLALAFVLGAPLVALNLGRPQTLVNLGPSPLRHVRRELTPPLITLGAVAVALAFVEMRRRGQPGPILLVMSSATLLALFGLIREPTRLTAPGIRMGGLLCPWERVERIVWADDERGVALRVRILARSRWILLPVPEGRSLEVLHALERFTRARRRACESSVFGTI